MYLWKTDNLVNDFSNENVTQYEQFKYMLLYSAITALAVDSYVVSDTIYNTNDFINTISLLLITIWGVRICYESNQQNDDKDFVARFICIGLPVVVRISAIFIPVYLIVVVIGYSFNFGISYDSSGNEIYVTTVIDVIFTIIYTVSYYQYLSNKIALIRIMRN